MVYTKYYVGETNLSDLEVKYLVIEKERKYGIALEQYSGDLIECDYEYFTEEHNEATKVARFMQEGRVTLTSMTEILDDYIQ